MSNCGSCDLGVSHSHTGTVTAMSVTHNGPICPTCGARYIGSHTCSPGDIMRRINELLALLPGTQQASVPGDPPRGCPCRPENGGSGVCGCILNGPRITC